MKRTSFNSGKFHELGWLLHIHVHKYKCWRELLQISYHLFVPLQVDNEVTDCISISRFELQEHARSHVVNVARHSSTSTIWRSIGAYTPERSPSSVRSAASASPTPARSANTWTTATSTVNRCEEPVSPSPPWRTGWKLLQPSRPLQLTLKRVSSHTLVILPASWKPRTSPPRTTEH